MESPVLVRAVEDFQLPLNRVIHLRKITTWDVSKKCFVYLLWMFLCLKFKNMQV